MVNNGRYLEYFVIFVCLLYKGIDHILAKHVAHLFIRYPVSLFEEKLNLDTENDSDHFEVCSTIWLLVTITLCNSVFYRSLFVYF